MDWKWKKKKLNEIWKIKLDKRYNNNKVQGLYVIELNEHNCAMSSQLISLMD